MTLLDATTVLRASQRVNPANIPFIPSILFIHVKMNPHLEFPPPLQYDCENLLLGRDTLEFHCRPVMGVVIITGARVP